MNKNFLNYIIGLIVIILLTIWGIKQYPYLKDMFSEKYKQKIEKLQKQKVSKEKEEKIVKKQSKKFEIDTAVLIDMKNLSTEQKKKLKKKISSWIYKKYHRVYKRLADEISNYLVEKSRFPLLIIGLAGAESSFIVQNTSSVNAYGLGQIRYSIWKKELGDYMKKIGIWSYKELYDPIKNLKLTERILVKYLQESDYNITQALVRYQTGARSLKLLKNGQKKKTLRYINKIFKLCGEIYVDLMIEQKR